MENKYQEIKKVLTEFFYDVDTDHGESTLDECLPEYAERIYNLFYENNN